MNHMSRHATQNKQRTWKSNTKHILLAGTQRLHQDVSDLAAFMQQACYRPKDAARRLGRHSVTTANFLVVVWCFALYWGEVAQFSHSVSGCAWSKWEHWTAEARPHHLVFIADPQLVDPHTYPGRPWPFSILTIRHTDVYLRRAYSRIQRDLKPDTVVFLGDLFDGGREWSTYVNPEVTMSSERAAVSPELQYQKYGEQFWLQEYNRFSNIFFRKWSEEGTVTSGEGFKAQRIIASLPGNHDLGFGNGIQTPVRDRFQAFFGEGNRVDVIGNHTFVSVDTVSLSAKEQEDSIKTTEVWQPVADFLHGVNMKKAESISRHLNHINDTVIHERSDHIVRDILDSVPSEKYPVSPTEITANLPTVLLTHVPLYRADGTPCGPLRERWPPTPPPPGQDSPVVPDHRNAIPSRGNGYQYQNALTRSLSLDIIEALGGEVDYVFSGDDHDYCELVHRGYPSKGGGVKEITVKSISWAMGVRKPGFLLVSMWHPIDQEGRSISGGSDDATLQTRLCLLPDQLAIFIRYAILLGVSISVLLIRAMLVAFLPSKFGIKAYSFSKDNDVPLLPTTGVRRSSEPEKVTAAAFDNDTTFRKGYHAKASSVASISTTESTNSHYDSGNLTARSAASMKPRSVTPLPSYAYGLPPLQAAPSHRETLPPPGQEHKIPFSPNIPAFDMSHGWREEDTRTRSKKGKHRARRKMGKLETLGRELARSLWSVAWVALLWYFWLLRR